MPARLHEWGRLARRLLDDLQDVARYEIAERMALAWVAARFQTLRQLHAQHARLHAAARAHHARHHPTTAPVNQQMHESLTLLDHLALITTSAVGTMYCALLFLGLSLVSLPGALATHDPVVIVSWIAQTCLQLVLLAVILAGQNLGSRHAELRAEADFEVNQTAAADIKAILAHLDSQDAAILEIVQRLNAQTQPPSPA